MHIYTKTGDHGETGLIDGVHVQKTDDRIAALGEIVELSAVLGVLRAQKSPTWVKPANTFKFILIDYRICFSCWRALKKICYSVPNRSYLCANPYY